MLHKTLQVFVEAVWVARLRVYNLLIDLHWVIIDERSVTCMHLIN